MTTFQGPPDQTSTSDAIQKNHGAKTFDLHEFIGAPPPKSRMNVLLLADDRHAANVVQDHISAFVRHSVHRVTVCNPIHSRSASSFNFNAFNVLIIHYSICILLDYFLPAEIGEKVKSFRGLKVQIIQDEYRWIDRMAQKMAELGVSVVVSSLELQNLRRVYHQPEVAAINFYSSLPGYVPEALKRYKAPPIVERELHVVYRGREVPYWLGKFGQEKALIAHQMRSMAERFGLDVNVGSAEGERIYGREWIKFLTSGKAMLATEGGASVFDFDGAVEQRVAKVLECNPNADFETVTSMALHSVEGNIVHKTITPRSFEAIALRTALVMYPGRYRGILKPWVHYIPLLPDGSNEDQVVRLLRNDEYLQTLVDRCYQDIVENGVYEMSNYIRGIDVVIERTITEQQKQNSQRSAYTTVAVVAFGLAMQLECLWQMCSVRWRDHVWSVVQGRRARLRASTLSKLSNVSDTSSRQS
jgi:hypothetical protein